MIRAATRKQLAKKVTKPTCQAETNKGSKCPFPAELNEEGYSTGACRNEYHQAQIRLRGEDW